MYVCIIYIMCIGSILDSAGQPRAPGGRGQRLQFSGRAAEGGQQEGHRRIIFQRLCE